MLAKQLIENDPENMARIAKRVSGKKILLVTEQIRRPQCTYSVIGNYLFHILQAANAHIIHHDVHVPIRTKKSFDIGIYSHYETTERMKRSRLSLKAMRAACKKMSFYANLVPNIEIQCDHYFLSRSCFLDSSNLWYTWWQFSPPKQKEFKRAIFIGRGIDPYLFVPNQTDFRVCLDARFRGFIKEGRTIKAALEASGIKVVPIGFTDKTWQVPRMSYSKVAQIYSSSSVFISTIPGIYEMPVIEAQCAGNAVISYKDYLPRELCCHDSSHICNNPEDVVKRVLDIKKNHNPQIPRKFVINWTWTNIVEEMSRYWA
jgi:hypothetical protein